MKDFTYKPIGNFGIGYLACFMLSDEVSVLTRYYKDRNRYLIELEKGNEYTSLTELEDFTFEGTEVKLKYSQFLSVFNNKVDNVKMFLEQYFLFDGMDVELIDKLREERKSIFKNLDRFSNDQPSTYRINLGDYLEGMEGVVYIKPKQSFIQTFQEIDFETETIYHLDDNPSLSDSGTSLALITDWSTFLIDNYIDKETIRFLSIPIVEQKNENDFLNGLKFTKDDVTEVIEKMDKDLKWISVIYHPKTYEFTYDDELSENGADKELFRELVKLGHSEECRTKYFVKSRHLFEGEKNNLYLPFEENDRDVNYSYYRNKKVKELHIRGVLIKDFIFNLPLLASVFEIQSIIVNIISKAFIPDISRNNVDLHTQMIINRLIGKAINLGALNQLPLQHNEKNTLKNYIENYYSANINSKPEADLPF